MGGDDSILETILAYNYRYGIPHHQGLPIGVRVFLRGIDTR